MKITTKDVCELMSFLKTLGFEPLEGFSEKADPPMEVEEGSMLVVIHKGERIVLSIVELIWNISVCRRVFKGGRFCKVCNCKIEKTIIDKENFSTKCGCGGLGNDIGRITTPSVDFHRQQMALEETPEAQFFYLLNHLKKINQ